MSKRRTVAVASDLHCGHACGLTPPPYWRGQGYGATVARNERASWRWYCKQTDAIQPVDVAIWNGDLIDGQGLRSGGVEEKAMHRRQQADMAIMCVKQMRARNNVFVYGTPYHTGEVEDWEDLIADEFGEKCHDHPNIDVNGLIIDAKHKIGSSGIPHGRATALLKEDLWNKEWAESGQRDRSNVLVRSHVHYPMFVPCSTPHHMAFITPALQLLGTRYGARQCSGTVRYGFFTFTVESVDQFFTENAWRLHEWPLKNQRTKTIVA